MSVKKNFINSKLDKKLKRLDVFFKMAMLLMLIIVIYDSFTHLTPLYYYLFFVAGLTLGKLFKLDMQVQYKKENETIQLRTGWFYLVFTLLLLVVRFIVGKYVLEFFHVIWATDALYLFFIGIYRSKWKGIIRQIDELLYNWASDNY